MEEGEREGEIKENEADKCQLETKKRGMLKGARKRYRNRQEEGEKEKGIQKKEGWRKKEKTGGGKKKEGRKGENNGEK